MSQARFHLDLIHFRMKFLASQLSLISKPELSLNRLHHLDHMFLDIRKIIEELMLLTLCAHDFAEEELSRNLRNEWHAEKLMKQLERINPNFFLEAIEIKPTDDPEIGGQFVTSDRKFLTREMAVKFYNFCGQVLHASNKPIKNDEFQRRTEMVREFVELTNGLLKCCIIEDYKLNRVFIVTMDLETNSLPEIFYA